MKQEFQVIRVLLDDSWKVIRRCDTLEQAKEELRILASMNEELSLPNWYKVVWVQYIILEDLEI